MCIVLVKQKTAYEVGISDWSSDVCSSDLLGARVIGTVGSDPKIELARQYGCDHVIQYRREDFVDRVKEITDNEGVQVAYDAVGKDTFFGSLACLAPCGHLANYGQEIGRAHD